MKSNALTRIIILSITIVILLGILLWGMSFDGFSFSPVSISIGDSDMKDANVAARGEEVHVDASKVKDLDILWVAGNITVQPGDVEDIVFSESGVRDERYAMVWKQTGSKLTIQFCKNSVSEINLDDTLTKDLTITVPRDWTCNGLDVDAAAANVDVNDLIIREVDIDGASGECDFRNCDVGTIDLDTASGDVKFYGSLQELDCDAASASFYAELTNVPTRIDMDSMSGDLDITLPADSGFSVSMDAMSGDFSSDFETTIRNGSYVHGDGACRIDFDGMSGDLNIRKGN